MLCQAGGKPSTTRRAFSDLAPSQTNNTSQYLTSKPILKSQHCQCSQKATKQAQSSQSRPGGSLCQQTNKKIPCQTLDLQCERVCPAPCQTRVLDSGVLRITSWPPQALGIQIKPDEVVKPGTPTDQSKKPNNPNSVPYMAARPVNRAKLSISKTKPQAQTNVTQPKKNIPSCPNKPNRST